MGSFSIWHWLIVLLIVIVVFGANRIKNIGKDVGEAVKSFKDAVSDTAITETKPDESKSQ